MKTIFKTLTLSFIILIFGSCEKDNTTTTIDIRIDHEEIDCFGIIAQKCLLVQEGDKIGSDDWDIFSDSIEGFTFESGYIYDLKVERKELSNPPQDASKYQYSLVKVKSKTVYIEE